QFSDVVFDFALDRRGELAFLLVVDRANLGRYRESWRHRQTGIRHLRQARSLAAKQISHRPVAFGFAVAEKVDVLPGGSRLEAGGSGFGSGGWAFAGCDRSLRH